MKLPISVIILTYNEELNLGSCLESVADWAGEIFVVDSYSTDRTLEIAKKYGCKIVQHPFENQARQFNWSLNNLDIKNDWILRLDADEYLTEELKEEISFSLNPLTPDRRLRRRVNGLRFRLGFGEKENSSFEEVSGFYIKRRVYFMGRWIKHGGYYPTWLLRLFRKGKARSEQREMDEHIILLEGRAEKLINDIVDDNKKNLEFWTDKHNRFSSREAAQILNPELAGENQAERLGGPVAKRRLAKKWYLYLPLFCRVFFYFIYRYFIRLGFLDGKEGLIFHVLQGFWYRFLVDAKIYERKRHLYTGD